MTAHNEAVHAAWLRLQKTKAEELARWREARKATKAKTLAAVSL